MLLIFATSCTQPLDKELVALREIVNLESDEVKIWEELIPLKFNKSKTYQDYVKRIKIVRGEIPVPKKSGNKLIPKPPSTVHNEYVKIGSVPFHVLILNDQLTEKEFSEIRKVVTNNKPKSRKINFGNFTKTSLKEIQKGGTGIKKFREYGYPILIENKLILYSNNYSFNHDYSQGEGKFEIYERIEGRWEKINTITQWIT